MPVSVKNNHAGIAIALAAFLLTCSVASTASAITFTFSYDHRGRLSSVTDESANGAGYSFDQANNLLYITTSVVDTDGDGLSDFLESTLGTNPNLVDTDGDTMPDGWEVANGTNPLVDDADGDVDADGKTNLEEYLESLGITANPVLSPILQLLMIDE